MATEGSGGAREQGHEEDEDEWQDEVEQAEANRSRGGEEGGAAEDGEAIVERAAPTCSLHSMLNDTLIIRALFYLDRPDVLLIAAVLSKSMNKNTQSDLLWRLTITDSHDMSAMVTLANRHEVLMMAAWVWDRHSNGRAGGGR